MERTRASIKVSLFCSNWTFRLWLNALSNYLLAIQKPTKDSTGHFFTSCLRQRNSNESTIFSPKKNCQWMQMRLKVTTMLFYWIVWWNGPKPENTSSMRCIQKPAHAQVMNPITKSIIASRCCRKLCIGEKRQDLQLRQLFAITNICAYIYSTIVKVVFGGWVAEKEGTHLREVIPGPLSRRRTLSRNRDPRPPVWESKELLLRGGNTSVGHV